MEITKLKIDLHSRQPIYEQVLEQIQAAIQQGELTTDDQLPPVRTLAALLGVNFNTIARAYRILDQQGWITTHQGRGTYVLEARPIKHDAPPQALIQPTSVDQIVEEVLTRAEKAGIPLLDIYAAISQHIERRSSQEINKRVILSKHNRKHKRVYVRARHSIKESFEREFSSSLHSKRSSTGRVKASHTRRTQRLSRH